MKPDAGRVRTLVLGLLVVILIAGCEKDNFTVPPDQPAADDAPLHVPQWGFNALLDRMDAGELPPSRDFRPDVILAERNFHVLEGHPRQEGPLTFKSNNGIIEPDGLPGDDAWVKLTIGTSSHPSPDQRPPLDLVIVVDGSGSMEQKGAELAVYTVRRIEDQLRDGDRVALIVAAEHSVVLRELSPWTATDGLEQPVQSHSFDGPNAALEGLMAGYARFDDIPNDPSRDRRVLWLTDDPFTREGRVPEAAGEIIRQGASERIGLTIATLATWPPEEVAHYLTATPGANSWWMQDESGIDTNIYNSFATVMSPVAWDVRIHVSEAGAYASSRLTFDHIFVPRAGELEVNGPVEMHLGSLYRSDTGFTGLFHISVRDITPEDSLMFFGESVPLLAFDIQFKDREGQEHTTRIVDAFANDEALFVPDARHNEDVFESPDVQRAVANARMMWAMREAVREFEQGDDNAAFNQLASLRTYLLEQQPVLYPEDFQTADEMIARLESLMGF